MLFGIIGTIDRGNFVFDSWPRNKNYPLIKGSISAGELSDKISEYFYYFGIYRKSVVMQTSEATFSETCLIQIFNANQKRLQVVLGIDDECVMISRSVFIINNEKNFVQNPATSVSSNLFVFQDLEEDKKDIVNSVTLVWRAESFNEVQAIKNKLSYMVGVLRHKEQSEDYLSRQIIKITQAKNIFQKKVKQKCQQLMKDPSVQLEQYKIKEMFRQFYDLADECMRDIQIFKQISQFYHCCVSETEYQLNSDGWVGSIGSDFKICSTKYFAQMRQYDARPNQFDQAEIESEEVEKTLIKTTLAAEKKLEILPEALRDERIFRLYSSVLNYNDVSLEEILDKERALNIRNSFQIIKFLEDNQIGLSVYPFDLKKYYNLYSLKKMPSWTLIKKFDERIFPNSNILKQIHPFGKFKRISALDEKLKYVIMQDIIKEVDVYIYHLQCLKPVDKVTHFQADQYEEEEDESQSASANHSRLRTKFLIGNSNIGQSIQKINDLEKFINRPQNLNEILREEPSFGKISQILKLVIEKIQKKKSSEKLGQSCSSEEEEFLSRPKWGFYYIEKP